ncbi:MAG: dipicolinate synthase subunit B [Clostridia bacterium]|nr:dipicolinate synthase subunit B [Clostridia bacterium]
MIGFALCGSFCTVSSALAVLEKLCEIYEVQGIVSEAVATTDTRFGRAKDTVTRIEALTGRPVIKSIVEAEPLGPKNPLDALVIAPCTGNTLAKMANGITDSTVTMAAKAHLRTNRPLLITLASNDALSANLANIGRLLSRKSVYFTPMRQDDPVGKPHSLVADFSLIEAGLSTALAGRQITPLFLL